MKRTTTADKWTPIRKGAIYCSPACGGRCTHSAYLLAKRRARKLADVLGAGWKPNVWENLGWHWSAVHAVNAEMHPVMHGKKLDHYWLSVRTSVRQVTAEGKTPKATLRAASEQLDQLVKEFMNSVGGPIALMRLK